MAVSRPPQPRRRVPPPPPPRIKVPRISHSVNIVKECPLSEQEKAYFSNFNIRKAASSCKTQRQLQQHFEHFFKAMYTADRNKWQYILEQYIMLELLTKSEVRKAFVSVEKWQEYLLPCLTRRHRWEHTGAEVKGSQLSKKRRGTLHMMDEKSLFAMTINMFVVLFYHVLITNEKRGGMRFLIDQTLDILSTECGWGLEVRMVASVLLISFLKKIGNGTKPFKHSLMEPAWNNLHEIMGVYYDFVFYRPCRLGSGSPASKARENLINSKRRISATRRISLEMGVPKIRSMAGIHLDASGCPDVIIIQQIVELLNRHLKVHQINLRISSDKKTSKAEKRNLEYWKFDNEVLFFTSALMYLKQLNALATSSKLQSDKEGFKRARKTFQEKTAKFVKQLEKKDKHLDTAKFRAILMTSIDTVLELQKSAKNVKIGQIAVDLYYGNRSNTVEWKQFGQMTVKLANLAQQAGKVVKRDLTKKSLWFGHRKKPSHSPSLKNTLAKKKADMQRYILTDMFMVSEGALRVQFFVPHLTEQSQVKLLVDQAKQTICVHFHLDDTANRKRAASKNYIRRDTKVGLLQKFVELPRYVDLSKHPVLRKQPNSVSLTFECTGKK
ncbi:hypothetical protein AAMO2058_001716500 [Amorphochlora amoebiformis]